MLTMDKKQVRSSLQIIDAPEGQIGGEIKGVDIKSLEPDSPEIKEILQAIYRNKVISIRDQDLSATDYIEFTRKLGRPQVYFQPQYHHPDHPEIFVSSNIPENGKKIGVAGTGHYWHTDCSFEPKPLSFTSIQPQIFPEEQRGTSYIDMSRVYQSLPDDLRAFVDGATCIHEGQLRYKVQPSDIDKSLRELLDWIDQEAPPVEHPTVITHPVTGDEILYINRGFTTKFKGLTYEENQEMTEKLFEFSEREEFVHLHTWQKNDLIIWDNRYLNHRSTKVPAGKSSKSYRIGVYDDYPFYVGLEK
ncbi:MAG: taurine dioxygenase [Paraglaciecola sp.]|jgi:taurine dioxygenase